jgi:acyl carrier protein
MESAATFDNVKDVVVETLGIRDRAAEFGPQTPLLGSIPELDSMAVLEVVLAIEKRFHLEIDASEMTGEVFETFGSLAEFIARHES